MHQSQKNRQPTTNSDEHLAHLSPPFPICAAPTAIQKRAAFRSHCQLAPELGHWIAATLVEYGMGCSSLRDEIGVVRPDSLAALLFLKVIQNRFDPSCIS